MSKGLLIVLESCDGGGKGTMVSRLVRYLEERFCPTAVVATKDPGGTKLGLGIRRVMFEENTTMGMAEGVVDLLFLATHLQNWRTVVEPALKRGKFVVSDRWWYSQMAYMTQRNVPPKVQEAYECGHGDPADLMIFLYGDPMIMLERARSRTEEIHQSAKSWNKASQQMRIQQAYADLFSQAPEWWPICIDNKNPDEVWVEVKHAVDHLISKRAARNRIERYAER